MILVDSSGGASSPLGRNAAKYRSYLETAANVLIPTIVLSEVYKLVKCERTEEEALLAAPQCRRRDWSLCPSRWRSRRPT
jgi:hypothetical protein